MPFKAATLFASASGSAAICASFARILLLTFRGSRFKVFSASDNR